MLSTLTLESNHTVVMACCRYTQFILKDIKNNIFANVLFANGWISLEEISKTDCILCSYKIFPKEKITLIKNVFALGKMPAVFEILKQVHQTND